MVAHFQQAHQGLVGFLIRKQGGISFIDDQGFQTQLQMAAGQQLIETVAEPVSGEDLESLCNLATEFSRYAAVETLRQGYLSLRGGGYLYWYCNHHGLFKKNI